MESYPTPPGAANEERLSPGFIKLHAGAPVHVFTVAEDIEFHDHPFDFVTHIIAGSYVEEVLTPHENGICGSIKRYNRLAGTTHEVKASTIHRILYLPNGFCVTRAEYGPTVQKPGFYNVTMGGILHRYWDEPGYMRSLAELQSSQKKEE